MMALSSFSKEIVYVINRKGKKKKKYPPLDLAISPNPEVYEYVGMSPKINPSGRSYGLLFE